VWAWGCGSGFKLGLGDQKDRYDPVLVPRTKEKIILQVSAGAWHSMAIIQYPPMLGGGVVSSVMIMMMADATCSCTNQRLPLAVVHMGQRLPRTARAGTLSGVDERRAR
jgi:hypothetical protein